MMDRVTEKEDRKPVKEVSAPPGDASTENVLPSAADRVLPPSTDVFSRDHATTHGLVGDVLSAGQLVAQGASDATSSMSSSRSTSAENFTRDPLQAAESGESRMYKGVIGSTENDFDPARNNIYDVCYDAAQLMYSLDIDSKGFISSKEFLGAIEDPNIKGRDAALLAALYEVRGDLRNQSLGPDGISHAAMHGLSDLLEKHGADFDMKSLTRAFAVGDYDWSNLAGRDGEDVTRQSLQKVLLSPEKHTPEQNKMAQYLEANFDRLARMSGDDNESISQNDLKSHLEKLPQSQEYRLLNSIMYRFNKTREAIEKAPNMDLYGDNDHPLRSINADSVHQGSIGNCYFEAALASVAQFKPELIQKMIRDNGDETFTVTLPGDSQHPITVKAPTQTELGLYNSVGENGVWASVLEKAFGVFRRQNLVARVMLNLDGGETPAEGADGGGMAEGLEALTGKPWDMTFNWTTSEQELSEKLAEALPKGNERPVIAFVSKDPFDWGSELTRDKFYRAHAYSILAFDLAGPDGGTVTVRNPWGKGKNSVDGQIDITLRKFKENFTDFIVARP